MLQGVPRNPLGCARPLENVCFRYIAATGSKTVPTTSMNPTAVRCCFCLFEALLHLYLVKSFSSGMYIIFSCIVQIQITRAFQLFHFWAVCKFWGACLVAYAIRAIHSFIILAKIYLFNFKIYCMMQSYTLCNNAIWHIIRWYMYILCILQNNHKNA